MKINSSINISKLEAICRQIRAELVRLSHKHKVAHLGSAFSCVEILVTLYWKILKIDSSNPTDSNRDRFILSKGHAASALYVTLAKKGFFSADLLNSIAQPGSLLAEHPVPNGVPGLELATGSLGHGLSVGLGMALSGRIQQRDYRVFVVLSDGECNEGSVWEAAMFASAKQINNVIAIIDYNKWQATGRSNEIMGGESLRQKWESFGWYAHEIDGHNINSLIDVLEGVGDVCNKPLAIVANTVKGKGVSFMEDDNNWHYRIPDEDNVKQALEELT
jgi:transketolase